jgi:hypothetical protein
MGASLGLNVAGCVAPRYNPPPVEKLQSVQKERTLEQADDAISLDVEVFLGAKDRL